MAHKRAQAKKRNGKGDRGKGNAFYNKKDVVKKVGRYCKTGGCKTKQKIVKMCA